MGKQHLSRDDRIFMDGKRRGTQECMDMVAMALIDKCGWHVQEETPDSRDTHSIAYLYECLEKITQEINEGRIKRKHIKDMLNAECGGNKPAVVALDMTHACDVIRECGEQVPALQARMGTGGNQVPLTYQMNGFGDYRAAEVASSCKQRDFKDSTDLAITHMVVRRLTPMECERLQGFPDHWTDIGEWTDEKGKKHKDADSPRYKALGNSIALPFWDWMLRRMARYLPEDATLGSLFDGIAGFPLIWERIHGKGTARWASEIEPSPIAVTKQHFPEEE